MVQAAARHRQVVAALGALAHEHRLAAFRLLVQAGDAGMSAGVLAGTLGLTPPTLSFHIKELAHAGLVQSRHEGRYVIYTARYDAMAGLLGYLTDNCCDGGDCAVVPVARRRSTRRTTYAPADRRSLRR